MNSKLTDAIKKMTLAARELLTREASEQLEGIYGFLRDGTLKPAEEYPAIQNNSDAAKNRELIEEFVENESLSGLDAKKARDKLVREVAFTWLNRFVAFKMLETRKLIRQTIFRVEKSNGFLMWLTSPGNEGFYEEYNKGDLPQDELGEGPRQRAYRCFILEQCKILAEEIRVLFDPDTLPSRLFPRPRALKQLIEFLNADEVVEAWQPGNEETIGWVYQGFNEPDLEIFQGQSAPKVSADLIAPKTQKFTPKWVVYYLVENTLGYLWIKMHPDSNLKSRMKYLIPVENDYNPSLQSIRAIKFLDPSCGTMHFGLVAFDLFYEMYKEEMLNAGKPGWPENPPVETEDEIPGAIIANNLYGIDIDLRAVQLSALTLYLKAKTINPRVCLQESNLACANIHMINGERLENFLKQMRLDKRPIYKRIFSALQDKLKDSEQLGSLLRLEDEIRSLIEKEQMRYKKEKEKPSLPGFSKYQFETEAGRGEFWEILEIQIKQAIDEFARQQAKKGSGQTFFTGEATKGLKLLELLSQQYDIIVTNPPYLDSRDMNSTLKKFIETNYPLGKRNLYATFTQRCIELLKNKGLLGILTGQTFMFISTYEKFRKYLLNIGFIQSLLQFDYGLFSGIRVDTSSFVLIKEPDEEIRNNSVGVYFRLVKEKDGEAKRMAFEKALGELRERMKDEL